VQIGGVLSIVRGQVIMLKACQWTHHFPIETERWYGIDHNNRLCNICTDTEIGDEFHFILECKSVANKRELYLITHFKSRMSTHTNKQTTNKQHRFQDLTFLISHKKIIEKTR
jgi:hypothetical protein